MITIQSVKRSDRDQVVGGTVIYVASLSRGIEKCHAKEHSMYGGNWVGLEEKIGAYTLGIWAHPDPERIIDIAEIQRARRVAELEIELSALKKLTFSIPEEFATQQKVGSLDWTSNEPLFEDDK